MSVRVYVVGLLTCRSVHRSVRLCAFPWGCLCDSLLPSAPACLYVVMTSLCMSTIQSLERVHDLEPKISDGGRPGVDLRVMEGLGVGRADSCLPTGGGGGSHILGGNNLKHQKGSE